MSGTDGFDFDVNMDFSALDALDELVATATTTEVHAGIIDGSEQYPDGMTVYDVACINEYGSSDGLRPPERAFIASTVERCSSDWQEMMGNAFAESVASGRGLKLAPIGKAAKGNIVETIDSNLHPHEHNAVSTIKRKHFDHPLIETGRLEKTVDYIITKKGI